MKKVLGEESLPNDVYNVFKNTTKYSYVTKEKIDDFLINKYGKKELKNLLKEHKLKKIMSNAEFRNFKKANLYKNKKPYGIPQGSGMSAVLSNIHLIDFDKEVLEWINKHKGLYRRYSDDLILIIPIDLSHNVISAYKEEIMNIIQRYKKHGLSVQSEKTEIRLYKHDQIYDTTGKISSLDYLGLVMDGKSVQLREKSLFNYYSRAYRKAKVCKNITNQTGVKYERKKLYQIYSHLGFKYKGHGNFITYSNAAHETMLDIGLNSNIHNQTKQHWNKIQSVLNE